VHLSLCKAMHKCKKAVEATTSVEATTAVEALSGQQQGERQADCTKSRPRCLPSLTHLMFGLNTTRRGSQSSSTCSGPPACCRLCCFQSCSSSRAHLAQSKTAAAVGRTRLNITMSTLG